jgi:hypothetical protein
VAREACGRTRRQTDVRKGLLEEREAALVELLVLAVAGVDALHRALVAITGGVELRPAGDLGEVRREALVVLRVQAVVLERVCGEGVGETELVPAAAGGEHGVETTERLVERGHAVILHTSQPSASSGLWVPPPPVSYRLRSVACERP